MLQDIAKKPHHKFLTNVSESLISSTFIETDNSPLVIGKKQFFKHNIEK